jgi:organic radical activating enzyme
VTYSVKEMFYTLQGEGARAGRPAVFVRFAGCNLWSGREEDRAQAICQFCDTQFVGVDGDGGGKFESAQALAAAALALWARPPLPLVGGGAGVGGNAPGGEASPHPLTPSPSRGGGNAAAVGDPYVVCTGGEPLLQLDTPLIHAFHEAGFEVAVETNGTIAAPLGIDWVCVSPKANANLVQTFGDELKLVYPQAGAAPERYALLDFTHFFLQPMDAPAREANTQAAIAYCLANPQWRLSLQTHKLVGLR